MAKRKTIIGSVLTMGLAVGLSFNTNVRNVFVPGPDTLLRGEVRAGFAETNERMAQLSEDVQELARIVALPAVFLVRGDSVAVADSARTRWVWEVWKGRLPERRTE